MKQLQNSRDSPAATPLVRVQHSPVVIWFWEGFRLLSLLSEYLQVSEQQSFEPTLLTVSLCFLLAFS